MAAPSSECCEASLAGADGVVEGCEATLQMVAKPSLLNVVPGVKVTAKQTESGLTRTVGSNQSGNGDTRIPDLPNWNPNFKGNATLGVDGFKKTGRYFDPNAFLLPLTGTFGNVSRGGLWGPSSFNVDSSLFKRVAVSEGVGLQFRAEFFNILNHANFDTPNPILFSGTGPNASAGVITETANRERQIQFALKILF